MAELHIPSNDGGQFSAYVAMPEITPAPAVIVIQEIFGVNQDVRDKCDACARDGFVAIAPDLFWRMEQGIQLDDHSEADRAIAFDLMNRFDYNLGVEDLRNCHHTLVGHADCTGKVGTIGYCLGGKLAYLMAARSSIDASVSYYGVGLGNYLEESQKISHPLMLHIAEKDRFVGLQEQYDIKAVLKDNGLVTMHSYPGADHAFARSEGEHYDQDASDLANQRSMQFLSTHLS